MVHINDVVYKYLKPQYSRIIFAVAVAIFGYLAYYGYNKYYKKTYYETMDVANANRRNKSALVYFFHADWCPHCKKAQPEWDKFMANFDGKEVNGYNVECVDIDCTNETADVKEMLNKFSIESFPTVKMVKDGQTIEFESKIKETTLEKFIDTMLN